MNPRFALSVLWIATAVVAARVAAADDLLPVEQAFSIEAEAPAHDRVQIHFQVADGYYLYRDKIKLKSAAAEVVLGDLELPEGDHKHDEFFGDVEVYHHAFTAVQPLTAAADVERVTLELRYQGCHQVDPKICYPPQKRLLSVALPRALAATVPKSNVEGGLIAPVEPLPAERAFVFEAIASGPDLVLARFTMAKGYYLYRDKTRFALDTDGGLRLGTPQWPPGRQHTDVNFGTTTVYFDQVDVPIPLVRRRAEPGRVALSATFQGCLEGRVCYPPMTRTVEVALPAMAAGASAPPAAEQDREGKFQHALGGSLGLVFGVFFLAGLGLAFTPCVFPMIPILSGIIAGAGANLSTRRALLLSLVYVLANAAVFTVAGVVAGLAGKNLQAAFQSPWVLYGFAGLFVLLALSMFGLYELQLPSAWQSRIAGVTNRHSGGSLLGVAIMGALSALIVGPCVTPPLAVAVLYIAEKHDAALGGFALFALALGMGAPLVVFGAGAGKLLPRAGAWMDTVKAAFGVSFLGLAIWMLSRVLDPAWIMVLAGLLAIGCAVYLGALERLPEQASHWRRLGKALGVVLLVGGGAELIGAAAGGDDWWQPLRGFGAASGVTQRTAGLSFRPVKSVADVERELAAAKAAGKPVLLDFYADWCVSCKEMERSTYAQPQVQAALADFVLLKADVTANDEVDQALMRRFGIVGPPGTLFFDADGRERRDLALTGPEDAAAFLARVRKVMVPR